MSAAHDDLLRAHQQLGILAAAVKRIPATDEATQPLLEMAVAAVEARRAIERAMRVLADVPVLEVHATAPRPMGKVINLGVRMRPAPAPTDDPPPRPVGA